jgi:hypothetical protein
MIRFTNRSFLVVAAGTVAFLLPRTLVAADLPKGEEILDKYITVTGGK